MNKQRGISFISLVLMIALGVTIVLIGAKLAPAYIEFFAVKKVLAAMAQDPAFPDMSPKELRDSFNRRATIDYIQSIQAKDLDIAKEDGQNVVSAEYSLKIHLIGNVSACLDFFASTSQTATPRGE